MTIKIIRDKVTSGALKQLAQETYKEMIKAVVDIQRKLVAVGGEWHADAEAQLLEDGSEQKHLWGINLYPDKSIQDRIVYNALINIRPAQDNASMDVQDESLRRQIAQVVDQRIAWEQT
jgi:hypothetical protein